MNKTRNHILDIGLHHLQNAIGGKLRLLSESNGPQHQHFDAVLDLEGNHIYAEVENEVRPQHVSQLVARRKAGSHGLIIARYITPAAKELLKTHHFNYVDRVGNIWFQLGSVLIHIEGIRNQPQTEDRKNRAFTKSGIKVVFKILIQADLINAPYREIATASGVSLGTIPKVVEGLREEGFLLRKTEKEWLIVEYEGLLDRWQQEYQRKMKPDLLLKRMRPISPTFEQDWKQTILPANTRWAGEPAGNLLTGYLRPELFSVYTLQPLSEIMKQCRWVPDPEGNIFVYQQFWSSDSQSKPHSCVPEILVYADLMASGDYRNMETATMIYERFISHTS